MFYFYFYSYLGKIHNFGQILFKGASKGVETTNELLVLYVMNYI